MDPNDITQKTIRRLFYEQIKGLTLRKRDLFDFQFSDRWLKC